MTDTPPDRMSTNPRSPHFDMEVLQRGIGIRFKGKERNDVEEYLDFEGWIRVAAGKSKDRFRPADDDQAVRRGRGVVRGCGRLTGEGDAPKDAGDDA